MKEKMQCCGACKLVSSVKTFERESETDPIRYSTAVGSASKKDGANTRSNAKRRAIHCRCRHHRKCLNGFGVPVWKRS